MALAAPGAATAAPPAPAPWISLASGKSKGFSWSVRAGRRGGAAGGGALGAWSPCLAVVTTTRTGPYSYSRSRYRSCSEEPGRLGAGDAPLIASGYRATRSRLGRGLVGILAAPAARWVQVSLPDGRSRTIALRPVSRAGRGGSWLGRLRYAAFTVRGHWCAERLVTLSSARRPLWDSGRDEHSCSAARR